MYEPTWPTNLNTMNRTGNLLIFPAEMESCQDFAVYAEELGFVIIKASSVHCNKPANSLPASAQVTNGIDVSDKDSTYYLPYATDEHFTGSLLALVAEHSITHIFTGHSGIWTKLKQIESSLNPHSTFKLTDYDPFESTWRKQEISFKDYRKEEIINIAPKLNSISKSQISTTKMTALFNLFSRIPGQSDETKLQGLKEILRVAPFGDIVEVGALYGRSAISMAWLANYYDSGNVIAVDPWCLDDIEGQGDKAESLNELVDEINCDHIFNIFLMNAAIFDNIGFIKAPSDRAVKEYVESCARGSLISSDGSSVSLEGKISVLHIDGNHRYDMVKNDIRLWTPYLLKGGWLLLDDYQWSFGEGPRKAGDELIESQDYDLTFCLGDTLYLRKS